MKTMNDAPMSDEALERLLLEVAPEMPATDAAARIKRRVLKRVADGPHPDAARMPDTRRA
jgi:hypothetical protein